MKKNSLGGVPEGDEVYYIDRYKRLIKVDKAFYAPQKNLEPEDITLNFGRTENGYPVFPVNNVVYEPTPKKWKEIKTEIKQYAYNQSISNHPLIVELNREGFCGPDYPQVHYFLCDYTIFSLMTEYDFPLEEVLMLYVETAPKKSYNNRVRRTGDDQFGFSTYAIDCLKSAHARLNYWDLLNPFENREGSKERIKLVVNYANAGVFSPNSVNMKNIKKYFPKAQIAQGDHHTTNYLDILRQILPNDVYKKYDSYRYGELSKSRIILCLGSKALTQKNYANRFVDIALLHLVCKGDLKETDQNDEIKTRLERVRNELGELGIPEELLKKDFLYI